LKNYKDLPDHSRKNGSQDQVNKEMNSEPKDCDSPEFVETGLIHGQEMPGAHGNHLQNGVH